MTMYQVRHPSKSCSAYGDLICIFFAESAAVECVLMYRKAGVDVRLVEFCHGKSGKVISRLVDVTDDGFIVDRVLSRDEMSASAYYRAKHAQASCSASTTATKSTRVDLSVI